MGVQIAERGVGSTELNSRSKSGLCLRRWPEAGACGEKLF